MRDGEPNIGHEQPVEPEPTLDGDLRRGLHVGGETVPLAHLQGQSLELFEFEALMLTEARKDRRARNDRVRAVRLLEASVDAALEDTETAAR